MTDKNKTPAGLADVAGNKDALKGWALMLALLGIVLVAGYFYAN